MTDLINKVNKMLSDDINSLQKLVNKYLPIIEYIKNKDDIPYLVYIIDICIKYIKENHNTRNSDVKTWCVVVVKDMFLAGIIKNDTDIHNAIDEYIKYVKNEFQAYANNHNVINKYDLDIGFTHEFIKKKIGK